LVSSRLIIHIECVEEYENMFQKRLEKLQSIEEENDEGEDDHDHDVFDDRFNVNRTIVETKVKNHLVRTFGTDAGLTTTVGLMDPLTDYKSFKKANRSAWNIYFYMSELTKIKKTSGIQFITDRYLKRCKKNSSSVPSNDHEDNEFQFEEHQAKLEESKEEESEKDSSQELTKLKFEKYILLLLLGSCDLSQS
jgi:hypothetical protein